MKKNLFAFAFFAASVFTLNAQNEDLSFVMQKDSSEKKEIPSYLIFMGNYQRLKVSP